MHFLTTSPELFFAVLGEGFLFDFVFLLDAIGLDARGADLNRMYLPLNLLCLVRICICIKFVGSFCVFLIFLMLIFDVAIRLFLIDWYLWTFELSLSIFREIFNPAWNHINQIEDNLHRVKCVMTELTSLIKEVKLSAIQLCILDVSFELYVIYSQLNWRRYFQTFISGWC